MKHTTEDEICDPEEEEVRDESAGESDSGESDSETESEDDMEAY